MPIYKGNDFVGSRWIGGLRKGSNTIVQGYKGEAVVYGDKPTGISKIDLDYWYDYSLGSYQGSTTNYDIGFNTTDGPFDLLLSGSGTTPTYDSSIEGWVFPATSKNFTWESPNPAGAVVPLKDNIYSMWWLFKHDNAPVYGFDYDILWSFDDIPTAGTNSFELRIAYQAGNYDRPVITIIQIDTGDTVAWDLTGLGYNFNTDWNLVQFDYSSASNPTGAAQLYVNNSLVSSKTWAIGLSFPKFLMRMGQDFQGKVVAAGAYSSLLDADGRTQLYNYYNSRYTLG